MYNSSTTGPHDWDVDFLFNTTTTIYNLLEAAGISWKVYYGSHLLFCNAFICQAQNLQYATFDPDTNRFFPMSQFFIDAAAAAGATGPNSLPSYSFIEPVYMDSIEYGPENDAHPEANPIDFDGPSNLLRAEQLLYDVYTGLRNSPNWDTTLLVITCDEHGGCYDHVPPSLTIWPDGVVIPPTSPGGSGFLFNRLGVRVPTILVSPWIAQGTVSNTIYDHTSINQDGDQLLRVERLFREPRAPSGSRPGRQRRGRSAHAFAASYGHATHHAASDARFRPDDRPTAVGLSGESRRRRRLAPENQGRSLPYWQQIDTTQEATTRFKRYEDNIRKKNSKKKRK